MTTLNQLHDIAKQILSLSQPYGNNVMTALQYHRIHTYFETTLNP